VVRHLYQVRRVEAQPCDGQTGGKKGCLFLLSLFVHAVPLPPGARGSLHWTALLHLNADHQYVCLRPRRPTRLREGIRVSQVRSTPENAGRFTWSTWGAGG